MEEKNKTPFAAALSYFLDKKWGAAAALARGLGHSSGYISQLASGKKKGEEGVRRAIANRLGYPYENFLALGQWLLDGKDPDSWQPPRGAVTMGHPVALPLKTVAQPFATAMNRPEESNIAPPVSIAKESELEFSVAAWLDQLTEPQKYGAARDALQALGVPPGRVASALAKLIELPSDLRRELPKDAGKRFDSIWNYVCGEESQTPSTWKERFRDDYMSGKMTDSDLYVAAQDWLNNLYAEKGK